MSPFHTLVQRGLVADRDRYSKLNSKDGLHVLLWGLDNHATLLFTGFLLCMKARYILLLAIYVYRFEIATKYCRLVHLRSFCEYVNALLYQTGETSIFLLATNISLAVSFILLLRQYSHILLKIG